MRCYYSLTRVEINTPLGESLFRREMKHSLSPGDFVLEYILRGRFYTEIDPPGRASVSKYSYRGRLLEGDSVAGHRLELLATIPFISPLLQFRHQLHVARKLVSAILLLMSSDV